MSDTSATEGCAASTQIDGSAYLTAIEAFADVAAALRSDVVEIDDLLHLVAARVCSLVGVGRCSIHLRDEEVAGMYRGAVGHAGTDIDAHVKRSRAGMPADGITHEVLETKAPVIVRDARTDRRAVRSTVRYWGIRSFMAVPMKLDGEIIGILFLDEEDQVHDFTPADQAIASAFADLAAVAVAHAQSILDLNTRLRVVTRENHGLKRATVLDQRLTDLVIEGADLQTITLSLAEVMGKPCALHSADGACLAAASPPSADDGILPRLLEPEFARRGPVAQAIADSEQRGGALVGPFVDIGLPHRYLITPIMERGERTGTLVVMEHHTRFNSTDLMVVRRAATLIRLHTKMERAAVEADANAGASLAGELIRGNPDVGMLRRRAEYLGFDLGRPRRLCLLRERAQRMARLDVRSVLSAFTQAAPDCNPVATTVGDDIAVLIAAAPESCSAMAAAGVEQVVRSACDLLGEDVLAAVSGECDGVRAYPKAYDEASQVLSCIERFWTGRSRSVVLSDVIGPARLFLASVNATSGAEFAANALGPVVRDASSLPLLATLHVFFTQMTSVRACADQLGVHENTIRYRLTRIAQLTGLSVTSDPDAQLSARMALLIMELRGDVRLDELVDEAIREPEEQFRAIDDVSATAVGDHTMP